MLVLLLQVIILGRDGKPTEKKTPGGLLLPASCQLLGRGSNSLFPSMIVQSRHSKGHGLHEDQATAVASLAAALPLLSSWQLSDQHEATTATPTAPASGVTLLPHRKSLANVYKDLIIRNMMPG